jgi:ribonuclease E
MKKEMLINVLQPEECRIAIVEDGVLEELYVERTSHESYVGNIYKGRIVNIEPSIQAAFVDFGVGRNGFLHVSDVEPAYYRHLEPHRSEGSRRGNGGRDRSRGRHRPPVEEDTADFGVERVADEASDQAGEPAQAAASESRREARPTEERRRGRGRSRRGRREDEPSRRSEPQPEELAVQAELTEAEAGPKQPVSEGQAEPQPRTPSRVADGVEPEPIQESGPTEGPAEVEPTPEPPRPRLMDSAERRTEEEDAEVAQPGPGLSDDDLFFPRTEPVEPAESAADLPSAPAAEVTEEPVAPAEAPGDEPEWAPEPPPDLSGLEGEEPEEELPEEFTERSHRDYSAEDEEPRRRRPPRDDRRGGFRGRRMGGRPGFGRPKPLIQDIFRRGQEVLVQVIKEGIGTKGPTLSTYISIAGRYLVLMPGLNRIGVSRKIADDEQRRRLREILNELQPPKGLGFIIRTAGLDKNKKELQRDLAYLSRLWQVVVRRIRKMKAPGEIYRESDMKTRTIRDTFTNEIDTVWVDEPAAFEEAQEFLQTVMPRYANRIKLYSDSEPLFHKYGIEDEIARIQQRHVPLPNGGSIVIEQTEALVAIDVNSGNFRADNNAEETAYQMNLLAAKEIARQLRLRDLGGVIVNDFIDMREEKHRRGVEKAMRDAVKRDRARTKILKISAFGIIEMTRQRIRPSLKRSVYQDCPYCLATGQVKTCESMSIDVMRMIQLAAHREHIHRIQIKVAEDVASYLLNKKRKEITRLEETGDIQVHIGGAAGLSPESLEFVCYDNNNNEIKFLPYDDSRNRRR